MQRRASRAFAIEQSPEEFGWSTTVPVGLEASTGVGPAGGDSVRATRRRVSVTELALLGVLGVLALSVSISGVL